MQNQVKELEEQEVKQRSKFEESIARDFDYGSYEDLVQNLKDGELPEIPYENSNGIVINLFCMDEVFESRSLDFVEFAFSLFPDRDYIIITQPFTVPENSLVKNFIQVPRKKNSTFEHCLYIYHKDSLFSKELTVRRSTLSDVKQSSYLLMEALNKKQIEKDVTDSITNPSSKYISFTVNCGG